MKLRHFPAVAVVSSLLLTGCTVLPTSPGWDPSTGWMQWDLELDDGSTGRWTSCLGPAACGPAGQHTWTTLP